MEGDTPRMDNTNAQCGAVSPEVLGYALTLCWEALRSVTGKDLGEEREGVLVAIDTANTVLEYLPFDRFRHDYRAELVIVNKEPPEAATLRDELLTIICANVDQQTLASMALVNRNWSSTANRMLWRHPRFLWSGRKSALRLFQFYTSLVTREGSLEKEANGADFDKHLSLVAATKAQRRRSAPVKRLTLAYFQPDEPDRDFVMTTLCRVLCLLPRLVGFELVCSTLPAGCLFFLGRKCEELTHLDVLQSSVGADCLPGLLDSAKARMIHLNLAGTLSLCRRMERFARALAACTEIRSLSLAAGRMDKVLVKAVSCLPRLEALDVSGTIFDDDQLELVLSSCSRINTLIVDGCNTLTSRAIDLIAAYGGSFTALSVANCNGSVTDYSLQKLAKSHHARTLTRLVLRNNTHVYDYALQIFGRFIRRLEVLDLGGCRDVTAPGLLSFLQGIPEQSLPLTRTPCSSSLEIAHPASHFNSWESPAGTQFTMQQYPTLRALNLTNLGSSFTRAAMHAILHACPKLTTVMIPEHVRGNARTEVMRRCHHSGNEASCGNSLLFQGSSWLRRGEIESAPRPAVLADGGAGDDAVAMVP